MHVLADPFEDDFESLPLAVRRKFFSNLERFRLERTRLGLTQAHPRHPNATSTNRPATIKNNNNNKRPRRRGHARARTVAITSPFSRSKGSLRLANHHGHLLDHESWQRFHSLPPKIQQSHFSKEEQRLLLLTAPPADVVDAADRALLKFEKARRRAACSNDSVARPAGNRQRSASLFAVPSMASSSTELPDSAIEMSHSILDSFRWLDEDDLDLSLDNYHRHIAQAARQTPRPSCPNRMPSFRRTLSFTRNRGATSAAGHRTGTSQSATAPFFDQVIRPTHSRHVSHPSTSSIDPEAQYYQDPEARLKLRVYLASPQKFDEAIEFGFPSLKDKENSANPTQTLKPTYDLDKRASLLSHSTQGWTFFDDQATSYDFDFVSDALDHNKEATTHLRKVSTEVRRPQPLQPLQSGNATGRRREMTLKMTLTRPDLRTTDPTDIDDPLRLADLPPADETVNVWDELPEQQGVVKKMWRRIRGRRD